MKKFTRFLTFCAFLLTVSFFSARPVFQPVSAQQIDPDINRILNAPRNSKCCLEPSNRGRDRSRWGAIRIREPLSGIHRFFPIVR
jgi:hypothetical protein